MSSIFLDLLFPHRCLNCGTLGSYICAICQKSVSFPSQRCPECEKGAIDGITHPICRKRFGLDGLTSIFRYEKLVKKAIKMIKYRFVSDIAESLINLVPADTFQLIKLCNEESLLYSIPLHLERLSWRGFNQAEKLAQFIAPKLEMPLVNNLLYRVVKRKPQADITAKKQRIENAKGIFQLATSILPEKVLLFDDVWTTGATMKEATKILKKAGVNWVWGLTLAR